MTFLTPSVPCILALSVAWSGASTADDAGWDGKLAERYSGRFGEIQKQIKELTPKLKGLPAIPIDDQGGTGGYASYHQRATPQAGEAPFSVEILFQEAAAADLIALVPARRYDAKGLDPQYGIPKNFSVDLIDQTGKVILHVADEKDTHLNPVRRGHPFVYQIANPVPAAGLRISTTRLGQNDPEEGIHVHAWSEAMVFQGSRNVALGGTVRSSAGSPPPASWYWDPAFLVDGQTPLGLPEIPSTDHAEMGWMSEPKASANEPANLIVDLGQTSDFNALFLVPAKRPTSDLPSGFGFPRKLVVSVRQESDPEEWTVVAQRDLPNPGHNPVRVSFERTSARYVKVEAAQLWKAIENYPAFFALSEVEVLAGDENIALGKRVQSPSGMLDMIGPGGRFWNSASLSDGFGPDGKLVTTREWLLKLDERLKLETLRYDLQAEAAELTRDWSNTAKIFLALLGFAAAVVIIVLPIRYRIHSTRQVIKIRERIAGDLHDEVGSNLGSIQMFADLAEGRSGPSDELKRIQRIAAETVSAVRDIVWLLRPTGDHQIGTLEHLRETSSIMLESLDWKFSADEHAWHIELPEETNRDLFLFFREALHNILRHSKATSVEIRADKTATHLQLVISDNGVGIPPERMERPATLRALRQRTESLAGNLEVESKSEAGTRLVLTLPLERKRRSSR